ncbi:MAG: BCCT family transporter [Pseudomonadales bacterium]|nr:BCCT family transporter [Pseudomonadales bacterium]
MTEQTIAEQAEVREPGPFEGIDLPIFIASVVLLLGLILPLMMYPVEGRIMLGEAFDYLTHNLGVLYIVAGVGSLIYLLVLAFGQHGSIVFARDQTTTQFSTLSWSAMLFCGGIGTSVVYWGTIEWAHYFAAPPFGLEPSSTEALLWSTSYPIFHWGFIGWAFYCLPGIAMGYAYYVKGASTLRLSEACVDVVPRSWQPIVNPLIDVIFVVGLVGACSTGIGLAVPLIGTLASDLFGLPRAEMGFAFDVIVILLITVLFALSAWLGLERGIKRLSNLNLALAFLLLLIVLFAGPTLFILELSIETVGHLLQNFVRMSTWADAGATSNFVESWTVFYWAWWLALGPFMGLFIAKISRGRTIKQIVLGCLGYGTLGCTVFFLVLGNYAAYLEINGIVAVLDTVASSGSPEAILAVLRSLPFSSGVIFLFIIVAVIFAATSYDSASYTLATSATRSLAEGEDPSRAHRIFWACLLGLLPITLIYMGGLRPLQSAVTIASVPLLVVLCVSTYALSKNLKKDALEMSAKRS